jgi:hypothetical protein
VTHREHDHELLGAYALGVLDPGQTRAVHQHLASCSDCRRELSGLARMESALAEVPAEAFLDGPPDGGDLVLRRTLRAVRDDNARARRQRTALVAAGLVLVASVAAGAGIATGAHDGAGAGIAAEGSVGAEENAGARAGSGVNPTPPTPDVRVASTTDPTTGATIRTAVTPAAGWVRVHADVQGIKAGKRCQLVVVARGGGPVVAGSWLVSANGEIDGTSLDGSALVAADSIAAVEVVTFDNEKLVSAAF